MAKRENHQEEEVLSKLELRKRAELLRGFMGLLAGSVAGVAFSMLPSIASIPLTISVLVAPYITTYRIFKRVYEASVWRGLLNYLAGFTLAWFCLYAAFIR